MPLPETVRLQKVAELSRPWQRTIWRSLRLYAREHNLSMIASADTGLYTTYWRRRELRRRAPEVTFVILSSTVGQRTAF